MARWLVERVLGADPGLEIVLADVDDSVVEVASRIRCEAAVTGIAVTYVDGQIYGLGTLDGYDAVLLGVPTHALEQVAGAVLPHLRDGALVFDICSTKVEPMSQLLQASDGRLSIIGTHPLFGPDLTSAIGQQIVVCTTDSSDADHVRWLVGRLQEHGATVVRTSDPEEHDRYMAYVQVLTHFVYMAFARTLQADGLDLGRAWDYQTPPFRFLASFAGRVVGSGSPARTSLYAGIQIQTRYPEVRDSFLYNAAALRDAFSGRDVTVVRSALQEISEYVSAEDAAVCQSVTGTAILAEQADALRLRSVLRSGELCGLETDRTLRVGIVRDLSATTITYRDALVPMRGPGPFALVHDEDACRAAAELGFHAGTMVERTIPRQAARLVTGAELASWLKGNLKHHARSLTIEIPRDASPERIARHLVRIVEGIVDCELTDVFLPKYEPDIQRATYDVRLIGSQPALSTLRELAEAVTDFALRPPPLT